VATAIHYPVPIHLTEAYGPEGPGAGSLPTAEALARRSCSLPMHPAMTSEEIELVAAAVHETAALAAA
jgi:dTDP-4-amino-4,6-dideoxygalactose transaminase